MKSGSNDKSQKKPLLSSSRYSFQKEWNKLLKTFHITFQLSDERYLRNRFCKAVIKTLELYAIQPRKKPDDGDVNKFIQMLEGCRSNYDVVNVLHEIPETKILKQLSKTGMFNARLGKILDYMREYFFNDIYPKQVEPLSAFAYEKLIKMPKDRSIIMSEFTAHMGLQEDFITFYPTMAASFTINNTKLRLSINEDQFSKAWDLLREEFLSAESPITNFKIINLKKSAENLEKFKTDYQKFKTTPSAEDTYYNSQLKKAERLTAGGQITLYLPKEISEERQDKIVQFLKKVTQILSENQITPGNIPKSDRTFTPYISGRLGATESDYISPYDVSQLSTDPVLNRFSESLTRRSLQNLRLQPK